jgi:heptosyltransferase I
VKKILLVKTSSLGDVVHNLPVVADIRRRFPQAAIDWVVEEAYAALAQMHPGVHKVIPVAVRRWRRSLLGGRTWREIAEFRRLLGSERYDAVIDTQGLVKSAVLTAAVPGRRHGFDAASAREPIAARFYDVVHHVPRAEHAVMRNRELVAAALGYRLSEPSDYGLRVSAAPANEASEVVLLHSTSRADKHWPEERWIELGRRLEQKGRHVVLPWGSEAERQRSERISARLERAEITPRLTVGELAHLLSRAGAVAGVDTGLTHLAAALGRPVAAIYCATDPLRTGVYGAARAANLGGPGRAPTADEVFNALNACEAL